MYTIHIPVGNGTTNLMDEVKAMLEEAWVIVALQRY